MKFKRGDQIAYIPNHANGDISHKDVEFGFVTSTTEITVFCRFWNKFNLDKLRTRANSEACNSNDLVYHDSKPQGLIKNLLNMIDQGIDP